MKTILKIALFSLVAASQCVQARSDDVVRIVNRLRAPSGVCAAAAPPVVTHGALNAAAARLARGEPLAAALKSEGYRMSEVYVITLTGEGLHAQLEALLSGRYCSQIGIPKLSEVGVHEDRNQIWIVLAAPFAPKMDMTRQQFTERMLTLVNQARSKTRRCGDQAFGSARAQME